MENFRKSVQGIIKKHTENVDSLTNKQNKIAYAIYNFDYIILEINKVLKFQPDSISKEKKTEYTNLTLTAVESFMAYCQLEV